MSFFDSLGLILGGSILNTLTSNTNQANAKLKNLNACSDQDRIEYLEKKIELLEAKLANKSFAEEYVNPDYPEGGWLSKFRPEDISHDGVYVRIEEGWVPVSSLSDIALKKRSG